MAYPDATPEVSAGDTILASHYNNLRKDAHHPVLQRFTYGETIAVNDAVYFGSDGKVYKTNAQYDDHRIHDFIGFAKEAGNANDVKLVQVGGVVDGFSGLTPGARYFLGRTAGQITRHELDMIYNFAVGVAISSTQLLIIHNLSPTIELQPSDEWRHSNDAEKSTNSTSYVKLKECKINIFLAACRIKLDLYSGGTTSSVFVAKNGTRISPIYSGGSIYKTETFDASNLNAQPNDLIQIWANVNNPAYYCYVRNFRFYFSRAITHINRTQLSTPLTAVIAPPTNWITNQDP